LVLVALSLSFSLALSFCLATPKIWQDLPSLSSSIPVSAGVDILVASVSEQVVFVDFLAAPARLCEYVAMFCVAVFVALVVSALDFEYMLRVAFTYCEPHTHTHSQRNGVPPFCGRLLSAERFQRTEIFICQLRWLYVEKVPTAP